MSSKPDSETLRQLLLQHLDTVERLVGIIARRKGLAPADADELLGEVNLKLVENDYEVLRRFSGRSSLKSYLTSVVTNLATDYQIKKWGKWRPSAKARRLGVAAVQLETLISRDGRSVDDAVEILRRNRNVGLSRAELYELAGEVPHHPSRYLTGDVDFDRMESTAETGATAEDDEKTRTAERVESVLDRALGSLASDERFLIRMVYRDDVGVTEISRMLGCRRQPLYRRVYGILRRLRESLEEMGVGLTEVVEVVGWDRRLVQVDFGDDEPDDDNSS